MLTELVVRDLGVIAEATILVGPGMTALTGETGAGKTLLVSAIDLLVGGRADPVLVRPGAAEARVDGRFVDGGGTEVVLSRVVPADGRSRAYLDGRPVPASVLAEHGATLVDLHGQHAHQSLLAPAVQRAASLTGSWALAHSTLLDAYRVARGEARARPATHWAHSVVTHAAVKHAVSTCCASRSTSCWRRPSTTPTRTWPSTPPRTPWPTPRPTARSRPKWRPPPSPTTAVPSTLWAPPWPPSPGERRSPNWRCGCARPPPTWPTSAPRCAPPARRSPRTPSS